MPRSQGLNRYLALLEGMGKYRRGIALQFALMGVSVGLGLLKPWPLKILVDSVAGAAPFSLRGWSPQWSWETLLLFCALAYLLLNVAESLVQVVASSTAALTSAGMIRDLRARLLARLQILALPFHDSHRVGDLVHRVTYNSTAVETALQSGVMGAVKSAITLLGIFIVMLAMHARLTIIALAVVPFLALTIRSYARRTHRVSLDHQNQEGRVSSLLQEVLSSIRLIKAYDRHALEQRRFEEVCNASVDTRLRSTLVQSSFGFFTASILAAGTALLFWVAIREVRAGNLTIGEFLVFNAYLAMLYSPLSVLSYTASSIQSALGGGSRLFDILEAPLEVTELATPEPLPQFQEMIRLEQVSFGYRPEQLVLSDISITIRKGERVAIVGPTGSGKSTLLSLLLRFYDPAAGAVKIDGTDIRHVSLADLRALFSYVPQDSLLLSGTIRENIAFGREGASDADIEAAARLADAHGFVMECEGGYDTIVGERGVRLSMGQRQRLALARAFLRDAPVFLLDEPTSALDGETEARVMANLTGLAGKTLITVAHRLTTVREMDRIIVLREGRVVESGTHGDLIAQDGSYAHLWQAQTAAYARTEKAVGP